MLAKGCRHPGRQGPAVRPTGHRDRRREAGAVSGRSPGRVLFVYLVLNRTREVPAAELLAALWPTALVHPAATVLQSRAKLTDHEFQVASGFDN